MSIFTNGALIRVRETSWRAQSSRALDPRNLRARAAGIADEVLRPHSDAGDDSRQSGALHFSPYDATEQIHQFDCRAALNTNRIERRSVIRACRSFNHRCTEVYLDSLPETRSSGGEGRVDADSDHQTIRAQGDAIMG